MSRPALCALLLILAGCGAAPPAATPDAATDTAAVQARVAAYVGHLLAGEGEAACAQLTPEYRRDANARARSAGFAGCAEAYSIYGQAVTGTTPDGFAAQASDPDEIVVRLQGDRAEAAMKSPRGGLSVKRTTLRRVGRLWLIDRLGISRPRYDG